MNDQVKRDGHPDKYENNCCPIPTLLLHGFYQSLGGDILSTPRSRLLHQSCVLGQVPLRIIGMTPRDQLLKMQRIILRQIKRSVQRLQGEVPLDLEKYYQTYKREFRSFQKISTKKELIKKARQSDIIFGADFHPFAQSQRTHLRILRELVKGSRPLILALETVDSRFQEIVTAYLNNEFDDATFLKKINYDRSWGFPWENYKVLFEFAKASKFEYMGSMKVS